MCAFKSVFVTICMEVFMSRFTFEQTQNFTDWDFWEILTCSRTACSTTKDSLFSISFTDYPSTVTFYEVQLQQLLLHQRHDFQKWCRNSRLTGSWSGWYYPLEEGSINRTCLEEQTRVSAALGGFFVFFLSYYISTYCISCYLICSLSPKRPLIVIKKSEGFTKVLDCMTTKMSSDKMPNKVWTFPLKEEFVYVHLVFVSLTVHGWTQALKNALFQQMLNKWWQNHRHQEESVWLIVSTNRMLNISARFFSVQVKWPEDVERWAMLPISPMLKLCLQFLVLLGVWFVFLRLLLPPLTADDAV